MLVYIAWIAVWQAMYQPSLWTGAASPSDRFADRGE
jgi:hypothetical protein